MSMIKWETVIILTSAVSPYERQYEYSCVKEQQSSPYRQRNTGVEVEQATAAAEDRDKPDKNWRKHPDEKRYLSQGIHRN